MYIAELQVKFVEVDDFERGCLPDTGRDLLYDLKFQAETLSDLLQQLVDHHDLDSIGDMDLNACEEIGRLDIQGTEDDEGFSLSPGEIEQWKRGKKRAWAATYTYKVSYCVPVDICQGYKQELDKS